MSHPIPDSSCSGLPELVPGQPPQPVEPPPEVLADPFLHAQLAQHTRLTDTAVGTIREPLLVRSADVVSALYLVDADAVQALIDSPPGSERAAAPAVRVLRLPVSGQAVVLFSMLRYKSATLEPYIEIAIQVLAHLRGHEARMRSALLKAAVMGLPEFVRRGFVSMDGLFAYVLALPVSTEQSRLVGQGLYNSPKYRGDLSMQDSAGGLVVDDGAGVRIAVPSPPGLALPMMPFPPIGTNAPDGDGVLTCRIAVSARSRLRYSTTGRLDITVAPGATTTLSAVIRALGLSERRPSLLMQDDAFKVAFLPATQLRAG